MNRSALVLLVSLLIAAAQATNHTMCFNYFLKKDGCVHSSADARTRCKAPPKQHSTPVKQFALVSQSTSGKPVRLARRYDTTKDPGAIGGGVGICGPYNSAEEIGVCLWSGPEKIKPNVTTAGWINGAKTSNCHKRIYIQRTNKPDTVQFVRVLDGCSFDDPKMPPLEVGCFQIGITTKLFNLFNPTDDEKFSQHLHGGITWDFDNTYGNSTQQGPV